MIVQQSDIMERLRHSTRDLHQAAEQHPFQQAMIQGTISRPDYVNYLGQMLIIHGGLELQLRRRAGAPPFQQVVRPHHYREHLILEDLHFLGAGADFVRPLPPTSRFVAEMDKSAQANPHSILGYFYVLEGSTNGAKYIAEKLQRTLGFENGQGASYLNPHGERQRDRWTAFKEDMAAIDWSQADVQTIVGAAESMFRNLILVSEALCDGSRPA